jgi:hypothetical protein
MIWATLVPARARQDPPRGGPQPPAADRHNFARWEREIAAYEAGDRISPPPKGAILFTGASAIKLWTTLAQDFPDHKVINRGFGGSEVRDATHFADRIIVPYEPRQIFLRAGSTSSSASGASSRPAQAEHASANWPGLSRSACSASTPTRRLRSASLGLLRRKMPRRRPPGAAPRVCQPAPRVRGRQGCA